jgi:maltose alpha-D-glucosyltransferase/alpha-amylase
LGEVLYTGKDFFIIDFEGEASRPVSERRIKRPLTFDLANMILSFHTAALATVEKRIGTGAVAPEKSAELRAWAEAWAYWVGVGFLKGYLSANKGEILKQSRQDLDLLLNCNLIDRAAKDVMDKLSAAPETATIPMMAWLNTLNVWNA